LRLIRLLGDVADFDYLQRITESMRIDDSLAKILNQQNKENAVMHSFFAYTNLTRPGLHLWREGTPVKLYLHPVNAPAGPGWVEFHCELNPAMSQERQTRMNPSVLAE